MALRKRREFTEPQAPEPPGTFKLAAAVAVDAFAGMFTGTYGTLVEDRHVAALRRLAYREGNPFPLISVQWPDLVVREPEEQRFFREVPQGGLDFVTPCMRSSILNAKNPVLRLDWWQRVILAGIFDPTVGELFIKGCTGAGKGAAVAIGNCLWFDVFNECRISLTGRDYTHAILNIFGETKQWFLKMQYPPPANVLGEGINQGERRYVRVLNPDVSSPTAGEAFSGAHGKNTLVVFDEATSHPDSFFENAEKNARKIVALANPRTMGGRFRESFKPLGPNLNRIAVCRGVLGNRLCVTISGTDCANVRYRRLKNPVAPLCGITIAGHQYAAGDRISDEHHEVVRPLIQSQIDLNQFEGIKSKSDPRLVCVFAYGQFPDEDPEKQIILRGWLDFHIEAHSKESPKVEAFGLDVARSREGDKTCLAAGGQDGCHSLKTWQFADINETCVAVLNHVAQEFRIDLRQCRNPVVVDVDGLGAGAADILRSAGVWVIEYHGNAGSDVDPRVYGNLRAEAYGTLGRRLNPDDRWRNKPWAIPADPELHEELCAPERIPSGADALRWLVTPKNSDKENVLSIKRRLGRSPDKGDAVAMLFHGVRLLHNMNEWFRNFATRELIAYPQPADVARAKDPKHDEAKPQPTDDEVTAWLRSEYGASLAKGERAVILPAVEQSAPQSPVNSWAATAFKE